MWQKFDVDVLKCKNEIHQQISGPFLAVYCMQSSALFQSIFKFFIYIFAQCLKYFGLFCPFLTFFAFSEELHAWPYFLEEALDRAQIVDKNGLICLDHVYSRRSFRCTLEINMIAKRMNTFFHLLVELYLLIYFIFVFQDPQMSTSEVYHCSSL